MSDATELEAELRQQLQEQIDTLASINAALQEGFDEELSAVKQQLEEAIPALQQSLAEVQQHLNEEHTHEAQQEQQLPQPAIVEPPSWLQSGAFCRCEGLPPSKLLWHITGSCSTLQLLKHRKQHMPCMSFTQHLPPVL